MQVAPIPTPRASIQDASSAGSAPAARAAARTTAAELDTPITTVISPAVTAEGGAAAFRTAAKREGTAGLITHPGVGRGCGGRAGRRSAGAVRRPCDGVRLGSAASGCCGQRSAVLSGAPQAAFRKQNVPCAER